MVLFYVERAQRVRAYGDSGEGETARALYPANSFCDATITVSILLLVDAVVT